MKYDLQKFKTGFHIFSWALYDLANQFFVLNIVSLYFVRWLTLTLGIPEIFYSLAFGISIFFVGLLAPFFGALSDMTHNRRFFLIIFTLLSVVFTMLLGIPKNVFFILVFFAIANFGCQMAMVFYSALMVNIAPPEKIGFVSGLGKMLGYCGAVLGLCVIKPVVLKYGYEATFLPTGIMFLIFSLPCMVFVKDAPSRRNITISSFFNKKLFLEKFKNLKKLLIETSQLPYFANFLKAAFFGLCAVNAVILFISVYATQVIGLTESQIIYFAMIVTLFALLGSFLSGFLSDYAGSCRCLKVIFILWSVCFLLGALVKTPYLYRLIAALVGLALGSVWVVSRALAIKIVPREKMGEVFGLFSLVGYLSAITGSLVWGAIVFFLADFGQWRFRIALLSLIIFMSAGFIFLSRIPNEPIKKPGRK